MTFALHLGHETITPALHLIRISSLPLRIIVPGRTHFKLLSLRCRGEAAYRCDDGGGGELPSTVGNCMEQGLERLQMQALEAQDNQIGAGLLAEFFQGESRSDRHALHARPLYRFHTYE